MEALWLRTAVRELARWHSGHVHKLHLGGLGFAGLDPGQGPTHCSSGPAVVVSHIQNEGRLARMLAVSSVTIFHTKKKKEKELLSGTIAFFPLRNFYSSVVSSLFDQRNSKKNTAYSRQHTHTHSTDSSTSQGTGPLTKPCPPSRCFRKGNRELQEVSAAAPSPCAQPCSPSQPVHPPSGLKGRPLSADCPWVGDMSQAAGLWGPGFSLSLCGCPPRPGPSPPHCGLAVARLADQTMAAALPGSHPQALSRVLLFLLVGIPGPGAPPSTHPWNEPPHGALVRAQQTCGCLGPSGTSSRAETKHKGAKGRYAGPMGLPSGMSDPLLPPSHGRRGAGRGAEPRTRHVRREP